MIAGAEIRSETVPTLIYELSRKGEGGKLVFRRDALVKTLQFDRGAIVFASSNDRDDRLIQTLLNRGAVSMPALMKALDQSLKNKRRLGEVLLEQSKISPEDLERALQDHLKEITYSIFAWTSGTWQFEKKAPESPESITLKAHPLELILEGVRRIASWARVSEMVGGLNTEYRATREAPAIAAKAQLLPGERQLLTFCEETRSLSEICEELPMNDFVLCKVVWGLLIVGALMKA